MGLAAVGTVPVVAAVVEQGDPSLVAAADHRRHKKVSSETDTAGAAVVVVTAADSGMVTAHPKPGESGRQPDRQHNHHHHHLDLERSYSVGRLDSDLADTHPRHHLDDPGHHPNC